jgi:hypothetical protein
MFPLAADYADYRWLVSNAAGCILAELACEPDNVLRAASQLRKRLSAERAHLVLELIELRRRATSKFALPERMFFTRLGLEQATDEWVAAYKSSRFASASGPIGDLCCGIGGDLLALACRRRTIGVDRNRITALLAEANLEMSGKRQAKVIVADAAQRPVDLTAWHIDPDRRPAGRRSTRVELHEPSLPAIESLLRGCPNAAVKLAPAARFPEHWNDKAELEWISREGESKQLVVWFGALAETPGRRRATIVLNQEHPPMTRTLVGDLTLKPPVAKDFGRYLAEPDSAVLAAGLAGTLAAEHGLASIAAASAYLTGESARPDPALGWFGIIDMLPFDLKRLKMHLRHHRIGHLEIKQRGVRIDPDNLRRQLTVKGDQVATLFLARRGKSITALLTQRIRHVD